MKAIYYTNDLLFSSRVASAAQQQGVDLRVTASPQALLEGDADMELVLLDLTLPGIDVAALVPQLRATYASSRIVAYGPHVHGGKLSAAQQAGCDEVLTRGQFDREMARLLGGLG